MASYDAANLIGLYTAGQDRRIAMDDRARKIATEEARKSALRDLFVVNRPGGSTHSTPPYNPGPDLSDDGGAPPSSIEQSYLGQQAPVAPPQRPGKFLLPKDAQVMRKSLGAGYDTWLKKNGLVEYDPAQEGAPAAAVGGPDVGALDIPPSSASAAPKINQQALARLIVMDPETGTQLINAFAKMDEGQRKSMENKFNAMGSVAYRLQTVPPEERGRDFQSAIDYLRAHGWTDQELQKADLSDKGLGMYTAGAVDVKTLMQETRQAAGDAETLRHNRVTERQAAERNDLSREREARITKWGPQAIIMGGGVRSDTSDLDY